MEMIVAYLVGVIVLIGLFAVRVPHEDVRIVFILGLAWPLSILAILFTVLFTVIGWDFNVDTNAGKILHFRRPTNPKAKGFALCVLGVEFQFYKLKKA